MGPFDIVLSHVGIVLEYLRSLGTILAWFWNSSGNISVSFYLLGSFGICVKRSCGTILRIDVRT